MKQTILMILSLAAAMTVSASGGSVDRQVREYSFSSFDKPTPYVTATHIPATADCQPISKAKGDDEPAANTVPVKIKFLHDTKTIRPMELQAMNNDDGFLISLRPDNEGEYIVDLSEGVYDLAFEMGGLQYFDDNDPTQGYVRLGTYFYIMDDVTISAEMSAIEIDASDCHPITPDFHLASGESVQPNLVDTTDPDKPKVITPGNIAFSSLELIPYNVNKQKSVVNISFFGLIEDNYTLQTKGIDYHTIYVNDASDKWLFFGNWKYANSDCSEVYSFTATMRPSDTKVSVTAADQTLLPWNFIRSKTYAENSDKRVERSSIQISYGSNKPGCPSGGSILGLQTENPKVYVVDKSPDYMTSSYILDDVELTNDWGMNSGIGSCEMSVIDGELKYLQTQKGAFGAILMGGPYDESTGKRPSHDVYTRGHKRFSSNGEEATLVFGKTAPILRVVNDISYDPQNDEAYSNRINPTAVGQYGEIREADVECGNLTTKFSYNGEVVEENYVGNPIMFCMEWCESGHDKGVMEYEMLTENIFEDGIDGYNKTYIYTDQTKEDPTAPTLTHLMCRDTEDLISNRFITPDKGVLEFSASDFSSEEFWVPQGWNFIWFESHPIHQVKAEWSPYGMNDWTEFEVEEVPEYFEEGFGTFYRGSLAGVDKGSANGWYDLRVTLCDATGNKQQQTISPVFRIESMAGVNALEATDADMPVEYYNMQGFRINTAAPGEVVIKRQGRHVSKKLVK